METKHSEILKNEDFEDLRCDKCKEYLNCPPIMVYFSTDDSSKSYTECGRCFNIKSETNENSLKPIRNISAETLAAVTPFPCKYHSSGCNERRIWPKIETHEKECLFRKFEYPLFKDNPCFYLTGMELIKKYKEEYPNLILNDGVVTQCFDEDFEQPFLIQQDTELFICKIRYDASTDKAWFAVILLENRGARECNLEFSDINSKQTVTLKVKPNSEEREVDVKAVRTLLANKATTIKCQVYLNMQLLTKYTDELLKEIQCPSCWDYMRGRIYLCQNGHNVCSACRKSLQFCPICREVEIQSTRNFSLEKVISEAFFPCKNHAQGCSYISILDEMVCHSATCRFSSTDESDIKTLHI